MSQTTTSIEVAAGDLRPIELEPVGPPAPSYQSNLSHTKTNLASENANNSFESLNNTAAHKISTWRAVVIIGTISCISLIQAMLGGILIVSLPTMARDIGLSGNLLLWPASVNALACGCTLLLSGSISDVVGGRKVYLTGCFSLVATTIACGVCRTGIELILFRAAQGVALSLCLPSSVSLITKNIPTGTYRNVAFACLGAGQPLGFSLGLVLGGVFVGSIGWRWGYYIGAILTFLIWVISIFGIPKDEETGYQSFSTQVHRVKTEIDWIGCTLLSTSLGMFSYVFSVLAGGSSRFLEPASLALFSIAVVLLPIFGFHIRRQERLGRKAIIPPSLLRNRVFTSLCITVFIIWGVFEAMQFFLTLFYQQVQSLSPIQTSLRFLPMVVTGTLTNFLTGWLVKRVRADILIMASAAIAAIAPLLMAIVDPSWSYWTCAFLATSFAPICGDVLFTVSNLLITSVFPPQTHGLAGGVFNTIANIGNSVGLAVTAVVASAVTIAHDGKMYSTPKALMEGYRASFWLCFGFNILVLGVIGFGLRKIGKVGIKVE
ncbi:related to aminotriazole resistance protein [Phialocephala subalpina]|uniref:Related to aminotriazole resistance protein n=1 Tax=Phialocephala subalpina TaxID=576137 RepID=A0A1L7WXZ9_9HELO|nr:related to aminotriazole resistance protein [Phialocephala subalpina]